MRLSSVLHNFVQEHRSGEVFVAPLDVFLDDLNVVQPDIAYVSSARSGLVTEAGIEGAPDLCIEVLSRRTAPNDKITKKKIFSAAGVQEYWLVNPDEGSIAVFRLPSDSGEAGTLFERCNKPALVSEMFPGLRIDLDQIFAR
jgi:Uma2 family endonuclease